MSPQAVCGALKTPETIGLPKQSDLFPALNFGRVQTPFQIEKFDLIRKAST